VAGERISGWQADAAALASLLELAPHQVVWLMQPDGWARRVSRRARSRHRCGTGSRVEPMPR